MDVPYLMVHYFGYGGTRKGRVKDESVKRVDTKRKKVQRDEYCCAPSPLDNPTQAIKGKEKRKEEKKLLKIRNAEERDIS